jgi:hypothetical protein
MGFLDLERSARYFGELGECLERTVDDGCLTSVWKHAIHIE